jgi:hypothetical protein
MVDWTDDLIATMRQHVADGCSFGETARRMGIVKNAVIGKAQRLGIESRFKPSGSVKATWDGAVLPAPAKPPIERGAKTWRTVPKPPTPVPSPPPRVGASPTCCWPLWGHKERPREHLFCAAQSIAGQSWCAEHYPRVFNPSPRREGSAAEFKLRQLG